MSTPSQRVYEAERLQKLRHYQILDTHPEADFDDLTQLAKQICEAPIALISLVDEDRQWFKSKQGLAAAETPRNISFCAHAIAQDDDIFVVPDALQDERFVHNPLVTAAPFIRFYAGAPLVSPDGYEIGSLCVLDTVPRQLTSAQLAGLRALGRQAISQMELRLQLRHLHETQMQLVQREKLSALGQLVAGISHEINNPINFIHGNLAHVEHYTHDLLAILAQYQALVPEPPPALQADIETLDLDFLKVDIVNVLESMRGGSNRVRDIVRSLRNFSRLDEVDFKKACIHEGLDSTLTILQSQLKAQPNCPAIAVEQRYGDLSPVKCLPGPLNQVFMNILSNAIDSLREQPDLANPRIIIQTEIKDADWVTISIRDNGGGISAEIKSKLFDPFFTTKEVGKGTGLGLAISKNIVEEKHGGSLLCHSRPGHGTEFVIELPLQPVPAATVAQPEAVTVS